MSITYTTSEIAEIAGLHPNTVRRYEEWGLIQKPERKKNGYRVYKDIHIKQFELAKKAFEIEILQADLRKRMVNAVKLSAILRMLNKLEDRLHRSENEILNILNTPDDEEDIISACDRLIDSLENAIKNAYEVIILLKEIKQIKI